MQNKSIFIRNISLFFWLKKRTQKKGKACCKMLQHALAFYSSSMIFLRQSRGVTPTIRLNT